MRDDSSPLLLHPHISSHPSLTLLSILRFVKGLFFNTYFVYNVKLEGAYFGGKKEREKKKRFVSKNIASL